MTSKSELGAMMALLYSAFGRELNEVDVQAWHQTIGDLPKDELAQAILHLARTSKHFPSASSVRDVVFSQRRSTGKLRPDSLRQAAFIGAAVKEWRARNPGATADQVAEYVSRLERRLSANVRG